MSYSVYILQSKTIGRRYIGYTEDVEKRLEQHNLGLNTSTRNYGPWKIIYLEKGFETRQKALKREKEIKKMKGGIQLKDLLHQYSSKIKNSR